MQLIDLLKTLPTKPTDRGHIILFTDIYDACKLHGISADTLQSKLWYLKDTGIINIFNAFDDADRKDTIFGVSIVK